ncbi:MAG: acyl-CoA dehydrogenase [Deltaproteobacteria bacterium]|nr:acyl-CoA dehydrogenase [Deltaproteobacteria bacterium]
MWGTFFTLLLLYIGYKGAPLVLWTLYFAVVLVGFRFSAPAIVLFAIPAIFFNVSVLRRQLTRPIMNFLMKSGFVPKVSDTEKAALEAGVVWVEQDIFSGAPNFRKLMKIPFPQLTSEEQAFLDGPVEKLCSMVDEWQVWQEKDVQKEVWDFLKREKFLGIIIPKEYGGLEFSPHAHSEILVKLASRSVPTAVCVMVPNSLGPAELLVHYGTEEQKKHYLPRLASGKDIPCFALTEPTAGSDAASIQAEGILFKKDDGNLYIRLNWNKRWITLANISTLIGLAFRLRDPENLLGQGENVGITCALIPSDTPGVDIGRRHDPLGVPFNNAPTRGKDVVVAAEKSIIGGLSNAGQGWRMLMESLAAGRGISLPGQSSATAKFVARTAGAHASIRKQFGMPIGKFEGVGEALGFIGGFTYMIDAMRCLTTSALNQGIKPPVITAIVKYHSTELARKIVNRGMDVMGGAGISLGPRNLIAGHYIGAPVAITVEGANILTRTLMIFGQGMFRAHPFAYKVIKSFENKDLKKFDQALWGHVGHIVRNLFRVPLLSISRGRLYWNCPKEGRHTFQKLAWVSASFSLSADIAMFLLGPSLKVRERITGRFADILSWTYIGLAIMRRHAADGYPKEDTPFVHWGMKFVFAHIQRAFDGIYGNIKFRGLNWFLRLMGMWSRANSLGEAIPDDLSRDVAKLLLKPSASRDRLTSGIFLGNDKEDPLGRLEYALKMVSAAEDAEKKVKQAIREKKLPKQKVVKLIDKALELSVISLEEARALKVSEEARLDAIQVDDFSPEEYRGNLTASVLTKVREVS